MCFCLHESMYSCQSNKLASQWLRLISSLLRLRRRDTRVADSRFGYFGVVYSFIQSKTNLKLNTEYCLFFKPNLIRRKNNLAYISVRLGFGYRFESTHPSLASFEVQIIPNLGELGLEVSGDLECADKCRTVSRCLLLPPFRFSRSSLSSNLN